MLRLREITGYDDDDDPGVIAARERFARERRIEQYRAATVQPDDAFRQGDYAEYGSIIEPFDDLLTPTQKKALAKRRAEG